MRERRNFLNLFKLIFESEKRESLGSEKNNKRNRKLIWNGIFIFLFLFKRYK